MPVPGSYERIRAPPEPDSPLTLICYKHGAPTEQGGKDGEMSSAGHREGLRDWMAALGGGCRVSHLRCGVFCIVR